MSDPDVCVFCAATGCIGGGADHGPECPFTTGMWPVDRSMVERETDCMACGERFAEGEVYADVKADSWPTDGLVNQIVAEWESVGAVALTICLPCAALGRPVES